MRVALFVALSLTITACGSSKSSSKESVRAEITAIVLDQLGSNAFGNLKLEPACVTVREPAKARNGATVVAAQVTKSKTCAPSAYLWIYSRAPNAGWSHDYLGTTPRCWDGLPADVADAVARSSGIALCKAGKTR